MNWDADEPPADEDESFGRPFLNRLDIPASSGGPRPGHPADRHRLPGHPSHPDRVGQHVEHADPAAGYPHDRHGGGVHGSHSGEVRPYLLTGGRTQSRGAAVAMETIVLATGVRPVRASEAAGLERARIVELADRPCSAAEVAAWLHLPLQVALVLVSDLVAEGLLDASGVATSQSDDVFFLERLIAGVAAL